MNIYPPDDIDKETKIVLCDGKPRSPAEAFEFLNSQEAVKNLMRELASK